MAYAAKNAIYRHRARFITLNDNSSSPILGDVRNVSRQLFLLAVGALLVECSLGPNQAHADEASSAAPLFLKAAEQSQWRYEPLACGGVPAQLETYIHIIFSLGN